MDNKKIGKLIASLRKKQNLTQQELGDKVGVGFRAVSKWERGLTIPDIGIINELSSILGITSDELLKGEIDKSKREKTKKKIPTKLKIIITTIIIMFMITTSLILYYNNKTYVYNIKSAKDEYYIEGKVVFQGENISLVVNKFHIDENDFTSTIIQNYEYAISSGNEHIIRYGYIHSVESLENNISILEFTKNFNINYNGNTKIKREKILENNLLITFKFLDSDSNVISKEIEIIFEK